MCEPGSLSGRGDELADRGNARESRPLMAPVRKDIELQALIHKIYEGFHRT